MTFKSRGTITEGEAHASDSVKPAGASWFRGGAGGFPGRENRPARLVLPTPRGIFAREGKWASNTGLKLPSEEVALLLRSLRTRDICILLMFAQHHYLTTDHIHALFFPSLRSAQLRLRWMAGPRNLLVRWQQLEPVAQGWRRRPYLFTLSQRGAAVLASALKRDPGPIAKRSWQVAEHSLHLAHDLDVVGFFVSLAVVSKDLTDQGLYNWIGQDTLRRGYREEGVNELAPDGQGRYLTPESDILFFLEWDRGTEPQRHLMAKLRAYASYFQRHGGAPVLFVAPNPIRERSITTAIRQIQLTNKERFWSTHLDLLGELGPLGAVWQSHIADSHRVSLYELPAAQKSGRPVEGCIGKSGWWNYRPGGGEGA